MPICEGCGSSFENTFSFCPFCGRVKPEPKKIIVEVDIIQNTAKDDCPICGNGMRTDKVSAIIDAGTSESNGHSKTIENTKYVHSSSGKQVGEGYSIGTIQSKTIQQSNLVKILTMKPDPPQKPSLRGDMGLSTIALVLIIFVFIVVLFIPRRIFYILGIVMLVALIVWRLGFAKKSHEKAKISNEEALNNYQKELADYNATLKIWNSLYYCNKHDIVFVPGSKEYAPKEEMWKACNKWRNNY